MPARQSGITNVDGMWRAGAGDYIARLFSSGRDYLDITRLLKERFPDAPTQSVVAVIGRYQVGASYASQLHTSTGPAIPDCRSTFPNPSLTRQYQYTLRLRFAPAFGGPPEWRTITILSEQAFALSELTDEVELLAGSLQSAGPSEYVSPSGQQRQYDLSQSTLQGFDLLYFECR